LRVSGTAAATGLSRRVPDSNVIAGGPGSLAWAFGCHELLDRVMWVGDLVEGRVLGHPSCALEAEWHRLARHDSACEEDDKKGRDGQRLGLEDAMPPATRPNQLELGGKRGR